MALQDQHILFVGIGFYDYEKAICDVMRTQGATVDYVNSTQNTLLWRIIRKVGLTGIAGKLKAKYRKNNIIRSGTNHTIVFVIKGQELTQSDIDMLHRLNPKARFVLYLWDSLIRHDNSELLLTNFSEIWSFDRVDCQQYPNLKFRPLFYRTKSNTVDKQYDMSFIGLLHSDRLNIVRRLRSMLDEKRETYFFKLYISKFNYWIERYIHRTLTAQDRQIITTSRIGYEQFRQVTSSSKTVLDISHPLQSGLTIRTLEVLAAGCHLLTTNQDICFYKQIDSGCYTLFDRENPVLPQTMNPYPCNSIDDYFGIEYFVTEILA